MARATEQSAGRADLPLYRQIKQHVLGSIRAGRLRPRDRVPSETELVQRFGVSRMTANRALRELARDGFVVRRPGIGTFVADIHARSQVLQVRNIADEILERGNVHSARVVECDRVQAPVNVARQLRAPRSTPLFHSLIVHYENGRPIQVEDRFVVCGAAPDYLAQDFTRITPNEYLSRVAPLQTVEHVISARIPDAQVRELLEIEEGEPTLVIDRLTWSDGRPVGIAGLHHPASRYELTAIFDTGAVHD